MALTARIELESVSESVQRNCHISDARHAADYTLCIYLLKMREYFRWETRTPLGAPLPGEEVGQWLKSREELWDSLDQAAFEPITVAGTRIDPFDTEAVNDALIPHGLVYSGGLGRKSVPHFFLGRLEDHKRYGAFRLLVSGEELARDLASPPAMTLGRTIFVRRESLRRMLWEKLQEWRWQERENAMARAVAGYPFSEDLDAALDAMTDAELESVILHEIGEVWAGDALGEDWERMLVDIARSRAELLARAVRDHVADSVSTLPALLRQGRDASLHFWVANLSGMRRELYPALKPAYEAWVETGDAAQLQALTERAAEHWLRSAERLLGHWRRHGPRAAEHIDADAEAVRL